MKRSNLLTINKILGSRPDEETSRKGNHDSGHYDKESRIDQICRASKGIGYGHAASRDEYCADGAAKRAAHLRTAVAQEALMLDDLQSLRHMARAGYGERHDFRRHFNPFAVSIHAHRNQ